jgi:hypothetical protein
MFRLKDTPKIKDRVVVSGGGIRPSFRGMRMPDGSAVPIELIMETHRVSREEARRIATRQTRPILEP